ncbi:MAG: DEAD/DEAH box helicase [Legionella sp.]|nr:DEAD/DEAH box helicase [Legionella sp.]
MNKKIRSFIAGLAAGLLGISALVALGIPALTGLSVFIPLSIVLAVTSGLVALFLSYVVPRLIKAVLQNYVEYKIKWALQDNDPDCVQLKRWLAFTNNGVLDASSWKYTFSDGQSLAEYAALQSNQHMQAYIDSGKMSKSRLFSAQSFLKGFVHLKQVQSQAQPADIISHGLIYRFLLWLKKSVDLIWTFNSIPLSDEQESERITLNLQSTIEDNAKNTQPNTDSLREKFTPHQLLDKAVAVKKAAIPSVKCNNPEKHHLPEHLRLWTTPLSLHLQIDKNQQQEHVFNAKQNIAIDSIAALAHEVENSQWIDSSHVHQNYAVYDRLKQAGYINTALWISSLKSSVEDLNDNQDQQQFASEPGRHEKGKYNSKFKFYISDDAKKVLFASQNGVRGHEITSDLDLLPLGFFLDREGESWTLKFNYDFRAWQLKNLPDANLLLDPAASLLTLDEDNAVSDAVDIKKRDGASKEDLLHLLNQLNITLPTRQLQLLNRLNQEIFKKFESRVKAQVFRALMMIASDSENPEQLVKLLDVLLSFETVKFSYLKAEDAPNIFLVDKNPLLYFFLRYHLIWIKQGSAFDHPRSMDYLVRLSTLTAEELVWFGKLTEKDSYPPDYYDFEELSAGLFYFVDFFKAQGIDLPKVEYSRDGKSYISGFQEPVTVIKGLLDCIALARNSKAMQQLQTRFFNQMPIDLTVAKAQLRAGYNFVHRAMCFDSAYVANAALKKKFKTKFSQFANPFLISAEEFKNTSYSRTLPDRDDAIYYRALYLRFIALNVDPAAVEEALSQWEAITRTSLDSCATLWDKDHRQYDTRFMELTRGVSQHWETLKDYALSLPRKNRAETRASYIPQGLANEAAKARAIEEYIANRRYSDNDISELMEKLSLDKGLTNELTEEINVLNQLIEKYHDMSPDELNAALKNARDASSEENIALLRETCYRLSRTEKNNHKGEWLRLEQLVSILISLKKDTLFQVETGEGKTLIIQFMALLKALDGKHVSVITHNEILAEKASDKLQTLATLLGLKVSNKNNSDSDIEASNIHYVDIANAVLGERLSRLNNTNKISDKDCVAIIDEADNVVIDVHANTTMQISRASQKVEEEFIVFLTLLNHVVRTELAVAETHDRIEHREIVRRALQAQPYYQQANLQEDETLDFWIKAAVSSMQCHEKSDYVIETSGSEEVVYIVHKDTTGRVDKLSQWSEGVHQCVAAWEKENGHPDIKVPGLSEVIAEGDIAAFLQENFTSRCGLTGTIGEKAVQQQIQQLLHTEIIVEMPRAKRPKLQGANWPKIVDKTNPEHPVADCFNRSYCFPPIYTDDEAAHFAKIVEALCNAHNNRQSSIVFFNTITECDEFHRYLLEHNFAEALSRYIQILDDTHDPLKAAIRPAEETIIERASDEQMITLTTAAGSRGTDFEGLDVGIIAKPGLGRVVIQKAGRIGRNGALGVVYEIYCNADLQQAEAILPILPDIDVQNPFRRDVELFEKSKQSRDLQSIIERAPLREENQKLQAEFINTLRKHAPDQRKDLENAWCKFFTRYGQKNNSLSYEQKLEQFTLELASGAPNLYAQD